MSLRAVAQHGADVMHEGELAEQLAADIQAAGGLVTAGDLARARPQLKPAMRAHAYGVEVSGSGSVLRHHWSCQLCRPEVNASHLLALCGTVVLCDNGKSLCLQLIFPPPPSSAAVIVAALHILSGYDLRLSAAGGLGTHRVIEVFLHSAATVLGAFVWLPFAILSRGLQPTCMLAGHKHQGTSQAVDSSCSATLQAMKHAFALRMSLGDPGPDPSNPFVNVTKQDDLLSDTLSRKFADALR